MRLPGTIERESRRFLSITRTLAFAVAVAAPVLAATQRTALILIPADGADGPIEITLDDLEAMPQTTIMTGNEFVDGVVAYKGPLARDVVAPLSPDRATVLRFLAANDYAVEVPAADLFDFDVILAMEADGRKLSIRDKGPLWLMYPISDHPQFAGRPYIDRLIWQVVSIEAQ